MIIILVSDFLLNFPVFAYKNNVAHVAICYIFHVIKTPETSQMKYVNQELKNFLGTYILYKVFIFLAVHLRNCGGRSFYNICNLFVTQFGFFIFFVNYGINFHVWMINDVGIYLFVWNNNPPEGKCRKVGINQEILVKKLEKYFFSQNFNLLIGQSWKVLYQS